MASFRKKCDAFFHYRVFALSTGLLLSLFAFAQPTGCVVSSSTFCDANPSNSALIMNTTTNKDFVFDSFSKYNGGITLNGTTILKVKVANNPSNSGDCRWKLQMIVSNGGATQTADPNEWETLASYGTGGAPLIKPTIDILQIRIDNACHTPQNAGVMQASFSTHDDIIDIINPPAPGVPPGAGSACSGGETNEDGTYLGLDYAEYSFVVDYRVSPGFLYVPGRYELSIKFCLTEQ